MKYSIVIAERNERENLKQTIQNIRDTQKGEFEIIVISDSTGKGPAYCRNEGIKQAKNDAIIIVDAHMRFLPGSLDKQAEYTRKNQNHLSCAKCHHNERIDFTDSPYCGADIRWKSEILRPDAGPQYWTLHGQWRSTKTTGEIGCVMGACYGLSRQNYVEKLKSPLRFGRSWGMDEEMLSISNWLTGGRNVLLDTECAHLYRLQPQVPYNLTHENIIGVWANRHALIGMLPMGDKEADELYEWLGKNPDCRNFKDEIRAAFNFQELEKQKEYYIGQKRKFSDWKNKHIKKEENEMKKPKREIMETMEVPPPAKRAYVIAAPVRDPGIPCRHCKHPYDHKVRNTWPNGNRTVLCGKCGLPFMIYREAIKNNLQIL